MQRDSDRNRRDADSIEVMPTMARKRSRTDNAPPPFEARKSAVLSATDPEDARRKYACHIAAPELAAARAINATEGISGMGELLDMPELIACLRDNAATVNSGDLSHTEAMLMGQSTALQSLFARLTERGMHAEYIAHFEAYMRMALRAQAQCRATLETLAAIKNPPMIYARQANIANGPQQVINGAASHAQAPEKAIEQSKLSGDSDELLPDARTPGIAGRIDSAMATLGKVDRAKDPRR